MNCVDFHVHIDFYDEPVNIICKYEKAQNYALFVTNLPEIFEKHITKYNDYKFVKLAIGYHPSMVSEYNFNKECFEKYLDYTNYIGEVGLDFTSANQNNKRKQIDIFKQICESIKNKSKIVSIHSKKAEEKILEILKENDIKLAVFHWYSGDKKYIDEIINLGYYFSINPNMLKTKNGRDILSRIPLSRIIFETDGPFIRVNDMIIDPSDIESQYKEFEKFYNISNLKQKVYSNFRNLLLQRDLMEKTNEVSKIINVHKNEICASTEYSYIY